MLKKYVGFAFIAGILVLYLWPVSSGNRLQLNSSDFFSLELSAKILVIWGFISAISIWFWMILDLYNRPKFKWKFMWWVIVVCGLWIGETAYFLVVYSRTYSGKLS